MAAYHSQTHCDGCDRNPLIGNRYKCQVCKDYDLCFKCHTTDNFGTNRDEVHTKEHVMHIMNAKKKMPSMDFNSPLNSHDRVLVAGGEKFYVQSGFLATWSTYFDTMFQSNFKESASFEIDLSYVNADEFSLLLNQLIPHGKRINNENVELLWRLGDFFGIKYIVNKCVSFLSDFEDCPEDKYSICQRLTLAYRYCHGELVDVCIDHLAKSEILAKFYKENTEFIHTLSKDDQLSLMHKLFKTMKI